MQINRPNESSTGFLVKKINEKILPHTVSYGQVDYRIASLLKKKRHIFKFSISSIH